MAFFKFPWFGKRSDGAEPAPLRHSSRAAQAQSVEQLRQRARHRLMGAAVLIGLATMIMVTLGLYLGNRLGLRFGRVAMFVGGVVLLMIGTTILVGHLMSAS